MLTVEKIIDNLTKLNEGRFIFKCTGFEEDFVKTYVDFKKYQKSMLNKQSSLKRLEWEAELQKKYHRFSKNFRYKMVR